MKDHLTYSFRALVRVPFLAIFTLILPIFLFASIHTLFYILSGTSKIRQVMQIGHFTASSTWLDNLFTPSGGLPFLLDHALMLSKYYYLIASPLSIVYIAIFILTLIMTAAYLGSWKRIFKGEAINLSSLLQDVGQYFWRLLGQAIMLTILSIPVMFILIRLMNEEIASFMVAVITLVVLATLPYHIVFHNLWILESIKTSFKYFFTYISDILGFLLCFSVLSIGIWVIGWLSGSYAPLLYWILITPIAGWLIGGFAHFVWHNILKEHEDELAHEPVAYHTLKEPNEQYRSQWKWGPLLFILCVLLIPTVNGMWTYVVTKQSSELSGVGYPIGELSPNLNNHTEANVDVAYWIGDERAGHFDRPFQKGKVMLQDQQNRGFFADIDWYEGEVETKQGRELLQQGTGITAYNYLGFAYPMQVNAVKSLDHETIIFTTAPIGKRMIQSILDSYWTMGRLDSPYRSEEHVFTLYDNGLIVPQFSDFNRHLGVEYKQYYFNDTINSLQALSLAKSEAIYQEKRDYPVFWSKSETAYLLEQYILTGSEYYWLAIEATLPIADIDMAWMRAQMEQLSQYRIEMDERVSAPRMIVEQQELSAIRTQVDIRIPYDTEYRLSLVLLQDRGATYYSSYIFKVEGFMMEVHTDDGKVERREGQLEVE